MTKCTESAFFVVVLHIDIAYRRRSSFSLSHLLAGIGLCLQRTMWKSLSGHVLHSRIELPFAYRACANYLRFIRTYSYYQDMSQRTGIAPSKKLPLTYINVSYSPVPGPFFFPVPKPALQRLYLLLVY